MTEKEKNDKKQFVGWGTFSIVLAFLIFSFLFSDNSMQCVSPNDEIILIGETTLFDSLLSRKIFYGDTLRINTTHPVSITINKWTSATVYDEWVCGG